MANCNLEIEIKYTILFDIVMLFPFLINYFKDKKAFSLYLNGKFDQSFTFRDVLNY